MQNYSSNIKLRLNLLQQALLLLLRATLPTRFLRFFAMLHAVSLGQVKNFQLLAAHILLDPFPAFLNARAVAPGLSPGGAVLFPRDLLGGTLQIAAGFALVLVAKSF